jgi:enoyl-CoA hydratase
MGPAFFTELRDLTSRISAAGTARVLVVSSTGRHFSAGLDVRSLADRPFQREDLELGRRRASFLTLIRDFQDAISSLERMRVPVLAAVQGGCVGGGLDLVTAADARYACTGAFFSAEAINRASPPDLGTLQRLPRIIPDGVARELCFTGRRMGAEEALRVGLVNEVLASPEALLERVLEVAGLIAAKSPLAVWGTKELLNHARDHTVADGLERTALWQAGMRQGGDSAESWRAFREKREPSYDPLIPE